LFFLKFLIYLEISHTKLCN